MLKLLAVAGSFMTSFPLPAQEPVPPCASELGQLRDACQKAVDIFAYVSPQLGTALAGGNATPGQGGHLGRLGGISLSLRSTIISGRFPDMRSVEFSPAGEAQSELPLVRNFVGVPAADLGVGLFQGLPLAVGNVGGIDLLASVAMLPSFGTDGSRLSPPGSAVRFGYGVRLGLLQESTTVPGISVTFMRRRLPTADFVAGTDNADTLAVRRMDLRADSWRFVVSRHTVPVGLVAGIGQDRYNSAAAIEAVVNSGGTRTTLASPVDATQQLTRTNAFASASTHFWIVRLVLEAGAAFGGNVSTYNSFAGRPADDTMLYGSLGLRVGF